MSIGRMVTDASLIAGSLVFAVVGLVIGTFLEEFCAASSSETCGLLIRLILRFGLAIVFLFIGLFFAWKFDRRMEEIEIRMKSRHTHP
jgi:hypothetical protein